MGKFLKSVSGGIKQIKGIIEDGEIEDLPEIIGQGVKKTVKNIESAHKCKSTEFDFDGKISKEEFIVMVKRGADGISQLIKVDVMGATVNGSVRSKSGKDVWSFKVNFDDSGKLTGRYWISTEDEDSDIPKIVADKIAKQIKKYPACVDESFEKEVHQEEVNEILREQAGAYCPYCGKQNYNEAAKFCLYCGRRFRL